MPTDQRSRFLSNIRRESERIRQLVDRLLALSAIEGLDALKQIETVDLAALTDAVLAGIRPQLTNTRIRLAVDLPRVDDVRGDTFLLKQAVANLIHNAVDFSPDQGRIEVQLSQVRNHVRLVVADDGPGIPEFARKRVFEKFFSLRRPRSGEKSTGLGLNFVQEIVDLHQGRIRLENRRPSGTRAVLSLPIDAGRL